MTTDFPGFYSVVMLCKKVVLTAGRAKKEMPINAHMEAMSLPFQVLGTASPYPTVHKVI